MKLWSLVLVIAAFASSSYAQSGVRGGRHYDAKTETVVTGSVEEVKSIPSPGRGGGGVHLVISTPTGSIEVHVGPASFVSSKHVTFDKGDHVTVTGSKVRMEGQDVLIAREIKKGEQVLTLRDAQGVPLWSGRGRRTR